MSTQTRTRDPKPSTPPTWDAYWETVGNEDYLLARELIDLSPTVRRHFEAHVAWRDNPCLVDDPNDPRMSIKDPEGWVWRQADLDWSAAAASADEWPASGTERRLINLVLSLVNPDEEHTTETRHDDEGYYDVPVTTGTRMIDVRDLASMGSWSEDVARLLARYIAGR